MLKGMPSGKIICTKNDTRYKWYIFDGTKESYLPKSERKLAEQLAAKKYYELMLEASKHELKKIKNYLKLENTDAFSKVRKLLDSPGYQELLTGIFIPESEDLVNWMKEDYGRCKMHSENLTHKTASGNYVRSKSEAIIDMVLHTNRIPFRYECALELDRKIIYPDFTIRHPRTGEIYYFEHFGLMDNTDYINNAYNKLRIYALNGIVDTIQLITTYETAKNPLTYDKVNRLVHQYFIDN